MDLSAGGAPLGPGGLARPREAVEGALLAQRGRLLLWLPVALGAGIGAYFALPVEPTGSAWAALALAGVAALLGARAVGPAWSPVVVALAVAAGGAGLAGWRAHAVAAPVLAFRYHGPVEGRIVEVDRSTSDALRLTLDRVRLEDVAPARTPARVRVSLRGDQHWLVPEPGRVVMMTAFLQPPAGPAEPGDFDFRRAAWFERLGAVGSTETPVLTVEAPREGLWLHRLRAAWSAAIRARIEGDAGGLAAAVTTGDRSGLSAAANEAMRDAGLYHVVSISGMHMGMLVAFVFGLVRTGVALVPPLALRVNGKKVAALAALPVAAFYLALAGRDVATERAFVTAAVMLGAILLDRQAVTLRSVAVAATVVLLLRPESLVNPGFQMSFAAAVALTVTFGASGPLAWEGRWRLLRPVAVLLLSSVVAGLATGPFAAASFNRLAPYGLVANLLAVPAMGVLVMPGAVLVALGAPLGLAGPGLLLMDWGCRWVLAVAQAVAGWDGAAAGVVAPPGAVLPLLAAGALWAALWQGRARWAGLVPIVGAAALWAGTERPALLVAPSGGLVGLRSAEGLALSSATADGFVAGAWLENDGDVGGPEAAAGRPGLAPEGRGARGTVGGRVILLVRGERDLAALDGCGGADLLVTNVAEAGERPCAVLDAGALRGLGAVAGRVAGGELRLLSAAEVAGRRPWTLAGAGGGR